LGRWGRDDHSTHDSTLNRDSHHAAGTANERAKSRKRWKIEEKGAD
jgi:hypothetical protein